jgi:transketolase
MISSAIGLSKEGLIPVVDTFAQFGVTKGNLPLIMSGLSCAPIVSLFSHVGFQDAADGASHQATTYFAATSALPQVQIVSLSCSQAAHQLLGQGLQMMAEQKQKRELPDSQLYFYGRETHPVSFNSKLNYEWGKALVLREGQHATLVATGPMVQVALEAAEQMKSQDGIELTVIDAPFINRPDTATISEALRKTQGKLITLEDHQEIGGMSQQLVHALTIKNIPFRVKTLGVQGKFGQSAYKARQLYDLHGLGIQGIKKAFSELN